ncbi:MAG TPA: response regulator [Thermoanaerobaculia bacterium]|nr:response regulator [Thermoanaerobaculia bacterium]
MIVLRNLSIRNKIIAIVLLAAILPLIGGFAFVVVNERRAFRREMMDNAVVIARVTAENSVADLAFGDRQSAENTLGKLSAVEGVEHAALFDRDGRLFAVWHRSGRGASRRSVGPSRLWSGDRLQVSEPVAFNGERWGTIALELTTTGLQTKLRGHLITLLLLTAIVVAAALFLGARLEKIVSAPILELAAIAREVSEKHDYAIRARTVSNDEIGVLADGFNEMLTQIERRQRERDEADQRTKEKSQFLANMSHELRTPLNAIIGFSEILKTRLADRAAERELKFLDNINSSGQHLLGIVNDILDLSKIEAGRMEITPERFPIAAAIDGVTSLMRGVSAQRRIAIEVDLEPGIPDLEADLVKIKQVLYNLVSNALKFSPEDSSITIRAESRRAEQAPLYENAIRISVIDRGIGIDPRDHARIFLEFQQVDSRISRTFGGTGLGLTLVKKFVDMHGGVVDLESALGEGSTFTVTLPMNFHRADEVRSLRLVNADGSHKPLVLVIEDEIDAFRSIEQQLRAGGFVPQHARSGEEGMALARELMPAAITLDLVLPGIDGIEVLKRLKADPKTRNTPVIIVSMTNNRELAVAFGASDYFVKPVDYDHLLESLRRQMGGAANTKLLVVDDDRELHDLLDGRLRAHGYSLVHAYGASEGFTRASTESPSLVILDLMMQEMNGFDLATQLKNDPRTSRLPIVVVTEQELSGGDRQRLIGKINAHMKRGDLNGSQLVNVIRELVRAQAEA